MEITVIDSRDHVGWAAAATRLGEVYMTDVSSMVTEVKKKANGKLISRLNILDHGNKTGIEIGDDWITTASLGKYRKELSKLVTCFTAKGFVHLQHCNIGANKTLLIQLAKLFKVRVYSGTGKHNPVYRFNFGEYVCAYPNGDFKKKVGRP